MKNGLAGYLSYSQTSSSVKSGFYSLLKLHIGSEDRSGFSLLALLTSLAQVKENSTKQ